MTIDFTKMRLSKKHRIQVCPKCGRRGELVHYRDGGGRCFHKAHREPVGLFIDDGCYWQAGKSA